MHALGRVAENQGNTPGAVAFFAESLALRREQAHFPGMAASLGGLGRVAAMDGAHERAARLLAAADAIRKAGGVTVAPDERVDEERLLDTVRAGLGREAFAAAWAAGRALPIEQAVAEALRPTVASG